MNYIQLPKLADEYGERGFKILAFPCNQFGSQEPGTHTDIIKFVNQDKFDPKMTEKLFFFEKADVNGTNAREVYRFIKPLAPNSDGSTVIGWNFQHFLIDHKGEPYKRYAIGFKPFDLRDDIEILLKKKAESG